jgi:hypothetical protein
MNLVNKINSSAAEQFGIGIIKRPYSFEGTEYVYRYNPYKGAALGRLKALEGVSRSDYNLLNDVPDEIYRNTKIQFDFLRDIANSKIEPTYVSNPEFNKKSVFYDTEHRFLTKLRGLSPDWWKNSYGKKWIASFNGLLPTQTRR